MNNPNELIQYLVEHLGPLTQMMGDDFLKAWMEKGHPALTMPGPGSPGPSPAAGAPGTQAAQMRKAGGAPPLEIYITGTEVVVCAILPGLASHEHVLVSLEGPRELTVEAFLQPGTMSGTWLQRERFSGHCSRTVTLPAAVQAGGARAHYADGVVEIRFQRLDPGAAFSGVAVLRSQ